MPEGGAGVSVADPLPVLVVVGSEPGEETKSMEVFLESEEADIYVFNGLLQAMAMHRQVLQPGDQVSMIMTRGVEGFSTTTGSIAMSGQTDRHVWDFRVEKRWAPKP